MACLKKTQRCKFLSFWVFLKLVLAVILSHFACRAIGRYWLHSSRRMNVHPSNYRIFKNAASVIIFTLALVVVLHLLPGPEKVGTTAY